MTSNGSHNLVCLLPVRNGEHDLPGYLDSVSRFADAVVALDDGSTDHTGRILKNHPWVRVLLSNPRRETYAGWDDSANRNALLAAAEPLRPRWILSLDADERISPDDAEALREFLKHGAVPGAAYGFTIHRMIGDLHTYDDDTLWVYRLFAYRRGQRFPVAKFHFIPVPTDISRGHWAKTTLRIQHLSGLTEEKRAARYLKYREVDPDCAFQSGYGHLLDPPGSFKSWTDRAPGRAILLDSKRHDRIAGQIAAYPGFREDLDPNRPALSVVVLSQDNRDRIQEVMDALVRQELDRPFEIILVNSGRDGTAEFVRERYPGVRVVHLPEPALPGKARNEGLKAARGEYIMFMGSHIVPAPGSLKHRVDAHERGYAMITGTIINGTPTWAGWASYFLDHWVALPNRPSAQLGQAPSRCSYLRGPLMSLGGFPEDRRTGEDTVVNNKLFELGHKGYRSAVIQCMHRSPCRDIGTLLRHHYERGRGFGKMLWEYPVRNKNLGFRLRRIRWLVTRYPAKRIFNITKDVFRYGRPVRGYFMLSFPLVVAGTLSAAWGAITYLLNPEFGPKVEREKEPVGAARKPSGELRGEIP